MSAIGGALPSVARLRRAEWLSRRSAFLRGGVLVFGANLVWNASNFAFNAIAARSLGPRSYGELAAAVVLLYVASPVLVSVQTVVSRVATALDVRGEQDLLRSALALHLKRLAFVATVIAGALALSSSAVARFLRLDSGIPIAIVGVGLCLSLFPHCQRGVLQGTQRFDRLAASVAVEATAKVVGAIALLTVWHSTDAAVTAIPLSAACGLAINALLLRCLPDSVSGSRAALTLHAGSQTVATLATFLLLALLLSADVLAAKRYLPSNLAGIYAAVSLCGKIVYFATSAISLLLFPHFSARRERNRDSRRPFVASLGVVAVCSAVIVAAYFAVPQVVVRVLYGPTYKAAAPYLGWIAVAFAAYALAYLAATYLLAQRSWAGAGALAVVTLGQLASLYALHGSIGEIVAVQVAILGSAALGLIFLALQPTHGFAGARRG